MMGREARKDWQEEVGWDFGPAERNKSKRISLTLLTLKNSRLDNAYVG